LQFERWIDEEYKTRYRVLCSACTYTPDHWEEDAEKAVVYWNTRPLEDAANARAEKAEAEAAELRVKLAEETHRREMAEKVVNGNAMTQLKQLYYDPWKGTAIMAHPIVGVFTYALAEFFFECKAENYVEFRFNGGEKLGDICLTYQRVDGKTPDQKLHDAKNEASDLRAALADANEDAEYLSWAAETLMQKWGSDELTMIDFARISAVIECRRARVGGAG